MYHGVVSLKCDVLMHAEQRMATTSHIEQYRVGTIMLTRPIVSLIEVLPKLFSLNRTDPHSIVGMLILSPYMILIMLQHCALKTVHEDTHHPAVTLTRNRVHCFSTLTHTHIMCGIE